MISLREDRQALLVDVVSVDVVSIEFNVLWSKISAASETQSIESLLHNSKFRMLCGSRYAMMATIILPGNDNNVRASISIFANNSVDRAGKII